MLTWVLDFVLTVEHSGKTRVGFLQFPKRASVQHEEVAVHQDQHG